VEDKRYLWNTVSQISMLTACMDTNFRKVLGEYDLQPNLIEQYIVLELKYQHVDTPSLETRLQIETTREDELIDQSIELSLIENRSRGKVFSLEDSLLIEYEENLDKGKSFEKVTIMPFNFL